MKKSHRNILIIVLVLLVVIGGYKAMAHKAPVDDVVVTEIPITGYSITDDDSDGIADVLPMELPPVNDVITAPTSLPQTLSAAPEPQPAAEVVEEKKEGFAEYAPRRWNGELL